MEPVNTCLKAVRRAGVAKGQTVLVVGQGPIGLILMQLCRWAGADVLVSDTFPDRLEMARRLGASVALDATAADVPREVRALTGGRGADLAVLAAFGQAPFAQAVDATRAGRPYHRLRRHIPGRDGPGRLGRVERRREGDPHVVQLVRGRPGPGGPARLRARGARARAGDASLHAGRGAPRAGDRVPAGAGRAQGRASGRRHPLTRGAAGGRSPWNLSEVSIRAT